MELEWYLRMRLEKKSEKDTQKSKHFTIKIHNKLTLIKDANNNSKNVEKYGFLRIKSIKILTRNQSDK